MFRLIAAGALLAASTAAFAAPAPKFLNEAARGDSAEIAFGQMLQAKGGTPAFKAYGQMLVSDHSAHRDKVDALARKMGVHVSHEPEADGAAAMRRMSGMHGMAFDRMARSHAIEDHQKDIATYQAQIRTGDRQTAQLARMTLPTLRKHLQGARALR